MGSLTFGHLPTRRACGAAAGRHPRHVTGTECIDRVRSRTPAGAAAVFHSSLYRLLLDCHMFHTMARSIQPLPRTHRSLPLPLSLPCPAVDRGHYCGPLLSETSLSRGYRGGRTGIVDLCLTGSWVVRALYEVASKGRVAYRQWCETGVPSLLLSRLLSEGGRRLRSTQ